jgi:tetratricopeptide (TPR) repeat protein
MIAPFLEARGLYAIAETHLKRAQQGLLSPPDNDQIALTWLHLGRIAELRGDLRIAERLYEQGLAIARTTGTVEIISNLLTHASETLVNRGEYGRAEQYLRDGLRLANELNNKQRMCVLLKNLGEVTDSRGDYAQGDIFYEEALEIARDIQAVESMGAILQNLGVKAGRYGNYRQALRYYKEGLECARKTRSRQRRSALLMNIGMLAFYQKHYQRAEKYYEQSLRLAREIENRFRESCVLQNLGMLERAKENFPMAEAYLQQSSEIAQTHGLYWVACETLNEWGELYLKEQQIEKAAMTFQEVLTKATEMDAEELMASAFLGLAQVAVAREQFDEAQQKGHACLALYEKMGHEKRKYILQWLTALPINDESEEEEA